MKGKIINSLFIFLIRGLRPLLGPASCKFQVTCGNYTIQQLKKQPTWYALYTSIKRILSCNPFF